MNDELNRLVVQANKLIESSYKLKANQQKFIRVMASMISYGDEDFKIYKFRISDLMAIYGVKDKSKYVEIPKQIKELMSNVLKFKDENNEIMVPFLSFYRYEKNRGIVKVQFHPFLKPFYLYLNKENPYTKYRLKNIITLRSSYSIRVYELLKQYENVKIRNFYVMELRDILGIGKDEYSRFYDFKRKVLLKSQEELKEKTDIEFEFEEIKTGRKVTSLKFYIKENAENKCKNNFKEIENKIEELEVKKEKNIVQDEEEKEINIDVFEYKNIKYLYDLFEEQISKKNIEKILENAENDIEKIEKIYNYSKTQNIENIVGFMLKMVKGDNFTEPIYDKKQIAFNDFTQREYDYDRLEKQLLGWDKYNPNEDDLKNNNELEINDMDKEEEKEEIIYCSEIDTLRMFLEEQLKTIFGDVKYTTWLKYGIDNLDIDDKKVVHFYFTNKFALNMFERNYKEILLELISSVEPLLKLRTVVKID